MNLPWSAIWLSASVPGHTNRIRYPGRQWLNPLYRICGFLCVIAVVLSAFSPHYIYADESKDAAGESSNSEFIEKYGITAKDLEASKKLWQEMGLDSLPAYVRRGDFGDELAALQLSVDRRITAIEIPESVIAEANEKTSRFRKERSVQILLDVLHSNPDINRDHLYRAYTARPEAWRIAPMREIASIDVREVSPAQAKQGGEPITPPRIRWALEQLERGVPFGVAADQFSEPDSTPGGVVGTIYPDGHTNVDGLHVNTQLIEAAFALQSGEVSEPLRFPGGWRVLYCSDASDGHDRTFKEAEPLLADYMLEEWFWLKVEKRIEQAMFTDHLDLEPAGKWVIPALYERISRLPLQAYNRKLNATEILEGIWRYYQPREILEHEVQVSLEKVLFRNALLADSYLKTVDIPNAVEIESASKTETSPAGQFFIVDTRPRPDAKKPPLSISETVHQVREALQVASQEGVSLSKIAQDQEWNLTQLAQLPPVYHEQFSNMLESLEVGKISDVINAGPYVGLAFRLPDFELTKPLSDSEKQLEIYKACLETAGKTLPPLEEKQEK